MGFNFVWITINILGFIGSVAYVFIKKKKSALGERRRFIDQLPSVLSSFGVLGTFIGITMGLIAFDTTNIDESIPKLLDGLKTAFYTSLAGMGSSILLQQIISLVYDRTEKQSDISVAAGKIVDAVAEMKEVLKSVSNKQDLNQTNFYKTAGSLLDVIKVNTSATSEDIERMLISIQAISADTTNIKSAIKDGFTKFVDTAKSIDSHVADITDSTTAFVSGQRDIQEEIKGFGVTLHNEVLDIEDQMQKTNKLLTAKFDEFSDLLQKSNTEALVEVMKKVTEEFQKQMNELINKLVQENFEQLNQAVANLIQWQAENKEMIERLTKQYNEMAKDFEGTSNTLVAVGNDTKALVSDGGKLKQIVNALNQVMVDDEKFIQITQNLSSSADSAKAANELFMENAQKLSVWLQKQKDFATAVAALINKLDEINKINDYSSQFWSETKKGMNESVNVLQTGSRQLQQQIGVINQSFYERLSATLGELDNLITSMLNSRR